MSGLAAAYAGVPDAAVDGGELFTAASEPAGTGSAGTGRPRGRRTSFGPATVDVPAAHWAEAVRVARDDLGCTYFDFLSAVDEPDGLRVVCHLARPEAGALAHLAVRTLLPAESPEVATVAALFAGARWHERETAEMFGVVFLDDDGTPLALEPLLLPPGFEGHPLRKDYLLASRLDRPWPGAKEPGESDADAKPSRRRLRPPGVPEAGAP